MYHFVYEELSPFKISCRPIRGFIHAPVKELNVEWVIDSLARQLTRPDTRTTVIRLEHVKDRRRIREVSV